MRLGIVLRQFNLRQQRAILWVNLVNLAFVGTDAPEDAVIPCKPVRADGRGGDATRGFIRAARSASTPRRWSTRISPT